MKGEIFSFLVSFLLFVNLTIFPRLWYNIFMKIQITAMQKTMYPDLMEKYENPIEHTCDIKIGQVFISEDGERPQDLCESAWESMAYFVRTLAAGGGNFYDGWMKNPRSAMISCNDGFRPVSFLIEVIEE